jgi:putative membrane protein
MLMVLCLAAFGALAVSAAEKGMSGKDKDFVMKAAKGGLMEVEAGQMARDRGKSDDVRNFGARMVTDHSKANEALRQVAQKKGIKLPTKTDRKDKTMMNKMKKMSGAEFDKAYIQHMVADHTQDVSDFRKATQEVSDPDVNQWAKKTLPVLEDHLKQAQEIAGKLGVDTGQAHSH